MAVVPVNIQITAGAERIAAAFGYTTGSVSDFLEDVVKTYFTEVTCAFEWAVAGDVVRDATYTAVEAEVTFN